MATTVKGMVQVHGVTYRIVRLREGHYDVIRVLDDVKVGMFCLTPEPKVVADDNAVELIRSIARTAIQGGKTTWAPRHSMPRLPRVIESGSHPHR